MNFLILFLFGSALFSIAQSRQPYEATDEKGIVIMKGTYFNGLEDSLWKYYENGKLSEESWYFMGKLHGSSVKYYDSGQPMIKAFFTLGEQDSTHTLLSKSGVVLEKGQFEKGQRIGVWENFDEKGQLTRKEEYQGERVKVWEICENGICAVHDGNGV